MRVSYYIEVANRRLLQGDFGVVIFDIELLNVLLLPLVGKLIRIKLRNSRGGYIIILNYISR